MTDLAEYMREIRAYSTAVEICKIVKEQGLNVGLVEDAIKREHQWVLDDMRAWMVEQPMKRERLKFAYALSVYERDRLSKKEGA